MRALLTLLIVCFSFNAQSQDIERLTAEKLWNLYRVSSLQVSPDGSQCALVATKYNISTNKGNGDIYLVSSDGSKIQQFTTGNSTEGSPEWSPDGKHLAFVAKREGDERSQLYVMPVDGGEATRITELPLGASNPKWLPDGKGIVCISKVLPEYGANFDSLKAEIARRKESKVSAMITEDRLYRYWDHYLTDGYIPHIFTVNVESKEVTDLTPNMKRLFSYHGGVDYDISPDGSYLIATALTEGPPYHNLYTDLYKIPTDGSGTMENLTEDNPSDDFQARFSEDGKYILYGKLLRTDRNAERTRLMKRDLESNEEIELCRDFDRSPREWVYSEIDRTVYFTAADRAKTSLFSVPFSGGAVTQLYHDGTNGSIDVHGDRVFYLHQSFNAPNELYSISTSGGNPVQLTRFNDTLLADVTMGKVEDVTFTGARGDKVQMYVIYPPGFDASKKWPLLVLIHGGPHGTFSDSFHPRWNGQLFAAPGYVAITPNFHGSTGFGEEFAECINGAHAEMPFVDVMAATDHMLAKGYIDSSRMAAAGGSYGGYLSAWVGGQTDRYACIINHAGVYNLMAQFGSDITHHRDISYGGTPWEDPDAVLRWSPSHHAKNYTTPTLVIHGEKDYRVPYGQGLELYGMLKAKKVPARLIIYPDENHWILSAQNSIHWYGEYHKWLDQWIGVGGK
ncbi:MAG: hypothetical protein CL946_02625 [Ectothiorhodospiraceae bacterium]|nr:hypothetical protein [Ectothiorhodospiraceae bacterium]